MYLEHKNTREEKKSAFPEFFQVLSSSTIPSFQSNLSQGKKMVEEIESDLFWCLSHCKSYWKSKTVCDSCYAKTNQFNTLYKDGKGIMDFYHQIHMSSDDS